MSDETTEYDNMRVRFEAGGQTAETTLGGLKEATERIARAYARPSADPLPSDLGPLDLYPVPPRRRFVEAKFLEAPDLEEMALELLAQCEEFEHIRPLRVRYLWRDKGTSKAMGQCTKASGFWRDLAAVDFVIWVGAEDVRTSYFTRDQLEALLYHELCHIGLGEDGQPTMRDHQAEIFYAEFARYGVWRRDYQRFGQLALDGDLERGEAFMPQRFGSCYECGEPKEIAAVCPACGCAPPAQKAELL